MRLGAQSVLHPSYQELPVLYHPLTAAGKDRRTVHPDHPNLPLEGPAVQLRRRVSGEGERSGEKGGLASVGRTMLHFFFTVAFSAVPLTLYVPPLRNLNLFVQTMEELARDSRLYSRRVAPRVRQACLRALDCLLCHRLGE
ncbi:hypothetical protein SAY87_023175 [Trapa incisa]|uniref:Uncharacterized protein n=1 Tax=Trapa incisa TaxID=236973 RepID=A0AAN7K5A9_9MYRT|nr:hypothetical protein SAY87_023175 [Trapa incisa]